MERREKGKRREKGPWHTRLTASSDLMLVFLPMCKLLIRASSMSVSHYVSVTVRGRAGRRSNLSLLLGAGAVSVCLCGGCRLMSNNHSSNWTSPMQLLVCQMKRGHHGSPFLAGKA